MSELERIISECLSEELPYCQAACPLHVDVQGYVRMVRQCKYDEALQIIRRTLPFPGIVGRICTHPCESACKRRDVDEALAIADLKRAANDHGTAEEHSFVNAEKEEKVAVIGGGPGGIMAAYDLRKMGYRVTIFEALPYLGGMLTAAIPDFRLPRDLVQEELSVLEKLGVEINLNTRVGDSLTLARLKKSFDTVIVATGAPLSRKLNIEGSTLQGVLWGLDFLRAVKLGDASTADSRVIVIGGGNVAIDAARSTQRLGAKEVRIVYRRTRGEMPAISREIGQALEEGVLLDVSWAPKRVLGYKGKTIGVEFVRSVSPYESKRRTDPILDEAVIKTVDADMVILAIGQQTDLSYLFASDAAMTRGGLICTDNLTLQTVDKGVFACGDVVTGPKSVVDALAAGRSAAISVDRYLRGEDLTRGRETEIPRESKLVVSIEGYEKKKRCPMPVLEIQGRHQNFREVELGYSTDQAETEAARCLECQCKTCVQECEFLKDLKETPKALARKLKEGLFREDRRLAYRCNICDLCKRNCENDLSLGDMFMEIRQTMVKEGLGPLPEHQFVKRDQDFAVSNKFSLASRDPGVDTCERVFFPGCGLSGYSPEIVIETYEHLRKKLKGTGLILGCCGGPTRFIGDESRFREIIGKVMANMKALGATEMIVACPDCYHTFRHCEPDLKVRPVSTILFEAGLPVKSSTEKGQIFSLHDSCRARWEKEWQDSVRALIAKLGHEIEEVENSRDKTRCCGLGGMVPYADPQLSARITRKRADEFSRDILTYCAGCREALAMFKPALHVLDLVFNADWQKVKSDPPKTGRARRENQARLKQMFLNRYGSSCTMGS
jgi:NADPH-dependent glutamate synthase beta subunit-like oxidoreductase